MMNTFLMQQSKRDSIWRIHAEQGLAAHVLGKY
jgi:hypothetical protein